MSKTHTVLLIKVYFGSIKPCICGSFDKLEDAIKVVEKEKKEMEELDKKCDDWGCWVTDGVCTDQIHYFIAKDEARKEPSYDESGNDTVEYFYDGDFKKIKKLQVYSKLQILSYNSNERVNLFFKDD